MTVSIIGCAPSSNDWFNTPCDLSIGVNDMKKFGHDPDWLVLVNRRFTPEREKTIKATKAQKVLTTIKHWKDHFNGEEIRLQPFGKYLKKGHVYSSKTSPFIAVSLAFNAGATDIILWGCDLQNHPVIKDKLLNYELRQWELFTRKLKEYGVTVWVTSKESRLAAFLPLWEECGRQESIKGGLIEVPFTDQRFWYQFVQNNIITSEFENHFRTFTIDRTESEGRRFIVDTIEKYGQSEWSLGEIEVISKDDKELVFKSVDSDFTATIDMTQPNAVSEFGDIKVGDKFQATATHD